MSVASGRKPYISYALHNLALELGTVELVYGGSQVGGIFIFDKPSQLAINAEYIVLHGGSPSTRVASRLRVHDIEARLARKVLEVLYPESM